MKLYTASLGKCARSCRRKYQLRYELGYRPAQPALELRFGTLCHHGMEAWWKAKAAGLPVAEWLDAALAAMVADTSAQVDAYELARAQVMLTGYHERWHAEPLDVIAVEAAFEGPLTNPLTGAESRTWRLAGKVDVLVRDAQGRVLVVEHKTSGEDVSPGSVYWQRLRLDGQVSVYFEGGRLLGHEVAACLYDVLAKPLHRPKLATPVEERKYKKDGTLYATQRDTDETPAEFRERVAAAVAEEPTRYFSRGEVVRLEEEMRDAMTDVWQLAQGLQQDGRLGRAPRNPDACHTYGRACEFWDVCTGAASLEDPLRFIRLTDAHPELAEGAVVTTASSSKEESPWQPQPQSPQ